MKKHSHESGAALPIAIIFSLVLVLIGVAAVNLLSRHSRSSSSQDELQEIMMMRDTISKSLDCRRTLGLTNGASSPTCTGQSLVLRDQAGRPLYPLGASANIHEIGVRRVSGRDAVVWEIKASCQDNRVYIERRKADSQGLFANFDRLFPRSEDPRLCESYFRDPNTCGITYDLYAWFDSAAPTCCRQVEVSGQGTATAVCNDNEYMTMGGAYCANAGSIAKADLDGTSRAVERCKLDTDALAFKHIGSGSARGITLTNPSLMMLHVDNPLPALMEGRATFPKSKSMLNDGKHGGFLLQSGYSSLRNSATVDSWVAACRYDDWEGTYPTTARAFCCPKKP